MVNTFDAIMIVLLVIGMCAVSYLLGYSKGFIFGVNKGKNEMIDIVEIQLKAMETNSQRRNSTN